MFQAKQHRARRISKGAFAGMTDVPPFCVRMNPNPASGRTRGIGAYSVLRTQWWQGVYVHSTKSTQWCPVCQYDLHAILRRYLYLSTTYKLTPIPLVSYMGLLGRFYQRCTN